MSSPAPTLSQPHPDTTRRDMSVILTMLVATFVMILNETILNVALARLIAVLHITPNSAQWLSTGFMLTMGVVIPTTGFLIGRFTTRRLFTLSLGLFCLGTLVAGLAPGFALLLAGRVLQASGTALMLPLLFTVILALIPPERRGSVMGTLTIVIAVAPAVGPTLSGLILNGLSWRYLFWLVLPVALGVLAYGLRFLQNVGQPGSQRLDLPSVGLSALGFGGLVYGFSEAGSGHWGSPAVLVPLGIGLLSLTVFSLRQLRLESPLLDLRAFRYQVFAQSTVLMMFTMVALFAAAILLPLYLQQLRGVSPLTTGLLLMPGGVLMGVASPFVGRLFDRHGPRALVITGAAILLAVLLCFSRLDAHSSLVLVCLLQTALNLGLSLMFTPVMTNGMNQLPPALHPHGSAIASTLQQVSGAVGTALLVTVMTSVSAAVLRAGSVSPSAALTSGLQAAFLVASGVALLALLMALFFRRVSPAGGTPAAAPH